MSTIQTLGIQIRHSDPHCRAPTYVRLFLCNIPFELPGQNWSEPDHLNTWHTIKIKMMMIKRNLFIVLTFTDVNIKESTVQ